MAAYKTTRRVEFRDTDMAGVVHFSAFFVFMEEVEHEFLRHLGLSVVMPDEQGTAVTWPRVAARCDYQRSVRFEDVLDVEVQLVRIGEKSVTYEFSFSHEGKAIAAGQMTSVCCRLAADTPMKSIPIPDGILQKLPKPPKN